MGFRFLSLIALFTGLLLFLLVGSFHLEWQPQPSGTTRMLLSVEFKLPKPVIEDINKNPLDSSATWRKAFGNRLRHAIIQVLADPQEAPEKSLKKTKIRSKNRMPTGFKGLFSQPFDKKEASKWHALKHQLNRPKSRPSSQTASGGSMG